MSDDIPLEVQEDILKRLPVKPLIQFRSVSKRWKSLIDSPEFIAAYGVRETHPNLSILRYQHISSDVFTLIDYKERYITFVDNDDDYTFTRQDFAPVIHQKFRTPSRLVGSSHGLLCFSGSYESPDGHPPMVVLWNPSISKSIGIEVPLFYHSSDPLIPWGNNQVIGFGVCPVTLDPTILYITFSPCTGFPWKVGVFSLSTGTWNLLSSNLPRESIRLSVSQVVIDRFIYWIADDMLVAEEDGQSPFLIVSFDLTAKEFKEIDLTGSLTNRLYSIQAISKLRESLVLLACHRDIEDEEDPVVFCVWMMKEQGVSKSFTKLYTINLPDAIVLDLLGCRKTGDLILETERQHEQNTRIEVYEPSSEASDDLGIDGKGYSFFMCYMETLLLHDHLDGFIYLRPERKRIA